MTDVVARKVGQFVTLSPNQDAIAERVRADKIDILVDLAGHTMAAPAHLAFALKPAPIQVVWLGVVSTTGMPTIDYFIGDSHTPAHGTERFFSETVYRLPRPCAYRPHADVGIAESPFFKNGYITFGSFNNPRKITRETIKLWSAILQLTPSSKIVLKYADLEKPVVQARLRDWLIEDGISEERIQFQGESQMLEYLCSWSEVDIALDTFPYNGGTTTMDALWMGVPVVTLAGRTPVACTGASLLSAVGLPVAYTPEQYISIAMFLVQSIPKTPGIRRQVRNAIARSEIMDEVGMARSLETAYREMWIKWCRSRQ